MALIRWEPARELRLLNSLFDTQTFPQNATRRWIPAVDVVESGSHLVLRADLPGLSEDDINIELDDNVLTISGERKFAHEERRGGYHRVERGSGSFRRSMRLPEGVDAEVITANFDRGVLEVTVPKPEQPKPHKVQIKVGTQPRVIEGSESSADAEPAAA